MEKSLKADYDTAFFNKNRNEASIRSAEVILSLLYDIFRPQSVIDIGCGYGNWLSVAEALGSRTLKGLDGSWVKKEDMISKNIDFETVDLEGDIELNKKYDLAISVEVAEHLSETRAKKFIETLCSASDIVLFGAAIKYQGGTNHINEQWQSYWIKHFESNGYKCFDIFRKAIWHNPTVKWWYRQNIFLFVNPASFLINVDKLKNRDNIIADIVHPQNYEGKIEDIELCIQHYREIINQPTLRFCVGSFKRYTLDRIKRLKHGFS